MCNDSLSLPERCGQENIVYNAEKRVTSNCN